MTEIATVRGPLPPEQLGATLMHEHVAVLDHELMRVFPNAYPFDRDEVVASAVSRLDRLVDDGIDTIVDMTVLGLGRDVDLLHRVASATRMQIVAATGAYVLRDLPTTLQLRGPGRTAFGGDDPLVDMFVEDITQGMEGTTIRAAVLKCATDRFGMTKDCERVMRAAAQAHRLTGVLISTHSNASHRGGIEQQQVLSSEGVPLDRVLIGHCGDSDDLDYLRQLLDTGSSIGMDRFGLDYYLPVEERVRVVVELVELGYTDRLVLSHDACCTHIGYTPAEMAVLAPSHDFSLVPRDILPALRSRGVSEAAITMMLVENPRRLLTPLPPAG